MWCTSNSHIWSHFDPASLPAHCPHTSPRQLWPRIGWTKRTSVSMMSGGGGVMVIPATELLLEFKIGWNRQMIMTDSGDTWPFCRFAGHWPEVSKPLCLQYDIPAGENTSPPIGDRASGKSSFHTHGPLSGMPLLHSDVGEMRSNHNLPKESNRVCLTQ